ncbi:hypothetical protein ACFY9C_34770 [Streptomyces filamentosus]|uniref:hypothetical protein n=1 Tax=Streptomyces filamentosus TaxID=67294 RepID=UPI0036E6CB1B
MTLIYCSECGGTYHLTPTVEFQCLTCDHRIAPRDISLDGQEAWAVDPAGRLGYVTDPAASLTAMDDAMESYLTAGDRQDRARALSAFQDAFTAYMKARTAGLTPPRRYTREDVHTALNAAADMINDELNIGESESDIVNLSVNASVTLMENPHATFEEVASENYSVSVEEILSWWDWGR